MSARPVHASGVHEELAGSEGARFGMWLFLLTELLLFGVLFTAYAVFRAQHTEAFHEAHLELNRLLGTINTVLLITSSWWMAVAVWAVREGRRKLATWALSGTFLLGYAFLINKAFEYHAKIQHGLFPGMTALEALPHGERLFFSLYFTLTGLHSLHVLAGLSLIGYLLMRRMTGGLGPRDATRVEVVGLYWHLVDLIWIYLFPLLYLIG